MGKCFSNILATFAEFEVDLLRMQTREGMAVAALEAGSKATPTLSCTQRALLLSWSGGCGDRRPRGRVAPGRALAAVRSVTDCE
jgi:hypothetical protein